MDIHHYSWTNKQVEFIQKCVDAHGQNSENYGYNEITFEVDGLSGLLLKIKGISNIIGKKVSVKIKPKEEKVYFYNLLEPGSFAVYDKGSVLHKIGEDTIEESINHRQKFKILKKCLNWNLLDCIYFFGYSFCTYYAVPSVLTNLKLIKEYEWVHNRIKYRAFKVKFPKAFNTHSRVQTFFFNSDGLLFRHDYRADIIFPPAYGSHFTTDYTESKGIKIAQNREVFMRIMNWPTSLSVLKADISVKK